MLTMRHILKINRMNDRCGPPEQSFSPGWHTENTASRHNVAVLQEKTSNAISKSVALTLRYVEYPDGNVTLWNDNGSALPEGARFLE